MRYPVSEIFGPTIQGEGKYIGYKSSFIRFAGCDCRCPWCDTKYAWDVESCALMTEDEILDQLPQRMSSIVVLTGGNPVLYDLGNLCERLFLKFNEVHLETQGTLWKDWIALVSFITVSPKREFFSYKTLKRIITSFSDRCQLKPVIFDKEDLRFAQDLNREFPHIDMTLQIGHPSDDKGSSLATEFCGNEQFNHRVRILPQLHRIFWGNSKGV
jgi:7-carboxy-7-deazaguanine synthase